MPEFCCCGNTLSERFAFKVIRHPCQCKEPGPRKARAPQVGLHESVSREQYEQRKRLGLPVMTDFEKGVEEEWG